MDARRVVRLLEKETAARRADLAGPFSVEPGPDAKAFGFRAYALVPVESGAEPVNVPVPVAGRVELGRDGGLAKLEVDPPDPAAIAEAKDFARRVLEKAGAGRPTHAIETDAAGRRVLRRIGFAGRG